MEITNPKLKRYQKKFCYSYCFGAYPTLDLLKFKKEEIIKVLVKDNSRDSDAVKEVLEVCNINNIVVEFNDRVIDKISFKENTYVVGVFNKYEVDLKDNSNHVVLVNPSNTGNLGTIIRSMLGFGFKDLAIVKPGVDIFDPKVVRSTMGAIFQVNFKYFDSIDSYISKYSNHNLYPFMLKGSIDIREVVFKEPFSFIQGNEGNGLSDEYSNLGKSVYIPHGSDIDSLNLSVATGIGLWEVYRKKEL